MRSFFFFSDAFETAFLARVHVSLFEQLRHARIDDDVNLLDVQAVPDAYDKRAHYPDSDPINFQGVPALGGSGLTGSALGA